MVSPSRTADKQKITFHSMGEGSILDILALDKPKFVPAEEAHRQITYIDEYVRDPVFECKAAVVEHHYIDRDHMEDHSVFYSKSLHSYPNFCRRIHFFSLEQDTLRSEIRRVRATRASQTGGQEKYEQECTKFSQHYYLGFSVIKPLPGCPVGRTVLKCFPLESNKGYTRKFHCACDYEPHLLGIRLRVRGLPFQQQDLGVSACATTALWTSLQRARQLEQSANATPAQITMRASQFNLRFGRSMPSEGLSLDQMCQAVQSFGYSPNLHRAESFEVTRGLLFSSISSGISPILIMDQPTRNISHAVAAAGMGVAPPAPPSRRMSEVRHRSADMKKIYVHDDRYGPYVRAVVRQRGQRKLLIEYSLRGGPETWELTHILIPLHNKIRLSFAQMYSAGREIVDYAQTASTLLNGGVVTTRWASRILRSTDYLEDLLQEPTGSSIVQRLSTSVRFSRYLGSVRIQAQGLDTFHVLLDTTSTERNLNCLAVVQLTRSSPDTPELCKQIVKLFGGQWIA